MQSSAGNGQTGALTGTMLGFTSEDVPEALSIYDFLFLPIREADASQEGAFFLKRFLSGMQAVWEQILDGIRSIPTVWSATEAPDAALPYVKWIVGWTSEFSAVTDRLDAKHLRKLIAASATIWRERGPEDAWVKVVKLLTGARSIVYTWLDTRYVVDESSTSEERVGYDTWLLEAPGGASDEYTSNLRVVDDGTGSLDRVLVLDVLDVMRALGERILVSWILFVDEFEIDGDRTQWTNGSGGPVSVVGGIASLSNVGLAESFRAKSALCDSWTDFIVFARIRGSGKFGVALRMASDALRYKVYLDITANRVKLSKVLTNVETVLVSAAPIAGILYANVWYGLRAEIEGTSIRVFLDGDLLIDTTNANIAQGSVGVFHDSGGTVDVDLVEVAPIPMDSDLVGP